MIQFGILEKNHHNNIDSARPGFLPDYSDQCPDPYIERHSCTHGAVLAVYGAHTVHVTAIPGIVPYMAYPGNFFSITAPPAPQPARIPGTATRSRILQSRGFCTSRGFADYFAHFTHFCIFLHTCLSRNLYQFKPLYAV